MSEDFEKTGEEITPEEEVLDNFEDDVQVEDFTTNRPIPSRPRRTIKVPSRYL